MEEIDLKDLIDLFFSKKILIIAIVLVATIAGCIYTKFFVTPKYTSSTSLVLTVSENNQNNNVDSTNSITTTDVTLNSKLVSTYSELVKSNNVLRQVINNLNLDISENSLKNNVSVKAVEDTELIRIYVTNEDPVIAAKIANEIAKVFSNLVTQIYKIENINIVDEAEVETEPSNINHAKDVIIFAFVGLVIAVAYIFILNMFDNTIKSSEDIEKTMELPVLVSIPFIENFDNKKGGYGA